MSTTRKPDDKDTLYAAIESGEVDIIKEILNRNAHLLNDQHAPHKTTPLFSMIYQVIRIKRLDLKQKRAYLQFLTETVHQYGKNINFNLETKNNDNFFLYVHYHSHVENEETALIKEDLIKLNNSFYIHLNQEQRNLIKEKYIEIQTVNASNNENKKIHLQHKNFEIIKKYLLDQPPPRLSGYNPNCSFNDKRYAKGQTDRNDSWLQNPYPNRAVEDLISEAQRNEAHKPNMFSIEQIDLAFQCFELTENLSRGMGPTFRIAKECDALKTLSFPCIKDAVWLVASQGNICEAQTRTEPDLLAYTSDRTQGPRSQEATSDAAISRIAYPCDMFYSVLEKSSERLFHYEFGYLTPISNDLHEIAKGEQLFKDHFSKIKMNVQNAWIDGCKNQCVTQILCCAPGYGSYLYAGDMKGPWDESLKPSFIEDHQKLLGLTEAILMPQYMAAAKIAILKSYITGKRIPLVLAPVGAGVFYNDPGIVKKCMKEAVNLIKKFSAPVDVVLSLYADDEQQTYKNVYYQDDNVKIHTMKNLQDLSCFSSPISSFAQLSSSSRSPIHTRQNQINVNSNSYYKTPSPQQNNPPKKN